MSLWRASGGTEHQEIRPMAATDVPAVERMLKESPEAAQWSPGVLLRGSAEEAYAWVAVEHGEVVGMIAARAAGGESEILNLAVSPSQRRRGLGTCLLQCAMARLLKAGARELFLEVRETNATARQFYAAMGFAETGRRRNYYRDPMEDALVLTLVLKEA
jgi:ribosomal-protein-alanine N-acetyltransferase